jgi:hypothetical protein
MAENKIFPGFPACLEVGYTQFINEWFEICQRIDNIAELKVVLYVIRHTWGYRDEEGNHQEMQRISTDEFAYGRKRRRDGSRIDRGTGLGLTSVKEGVKRAIEHGYLVCEVDDSDLARIEKSYGLRFLEETEEDSDGQNPTIDSQNVTICSRDVTTSGQNPASGGPDADERSYKETPETNPQKETMRNMPHSQFFDETLEFIEKKEQITYHQLERFLHRFMKVRGMRDIFLTKWKNAIAWAGISSEFCEIFMELQASGKINLCFGTEEMYKKGRRPRLPLATELADHEEKEWHPMYIKYNKQEG